ARIRSSPKPSAGHGLSDSIQLAAESLELGAVLLTLGFLRFDDLGRRLPREVRVRELALRAGEFLPDAPELRLHVACPVLARPDDALEDPGRVTAQRDANAASPVDPRRELRVLERAEVTRELRLGLGPRRHDQPVV